MRILLFSVFLISLILFYIKTFKKRRWKTPSGDLTENQIAILEEHIYFYKKLDSDKKKHFQNDVQEFLLNYKITPVSTTITDKERILIAASGVIPIFAFPDWKYQNLKEILVYADTFNKEFEVKGEQRNVLGMVGTGSYSYKMLLSKRAIIDGFESDRDGHHTAIHEFVHLIDGTDGDIDGVPNVLLEQPYIKPWFNLMNDEINNIRQNDSALRAYGATSNSEFFAVASEYFFERPDLLEENHPELFDLLKLIYKVK